MKTYLALLLAALLLSGCTGGQEEAQTPAQPDAEFQNISMSQNVDTYFIDGALSNNEFTATQRVNYVNKEQQSLNELYFHLYPNIYQNEDMFEADSKSTYFPDGFSKGGIELIEVSLLGVPLETEQNGTLLKIKLNSPLSPMDSLIITFRYKTVLPKGHARMSYSDNCYNLTGFYPVAAVYDDGWKTDKYSNVGDPFFTDIADYYITLSVPENYTVASTGMYTARRENGQQTVKITAGHVREAAIVVSPELKLYEDTVDGITVRSYAADDVYGAKALAYAKDSLSYYNKAFGKYPYPQFSVVQSSFHGGGMEYPNLVLISEEFYNENELANLEWIIAHETAHQWWYGLVGSDPTNDPFMDESLTEFSTLLYTRNKYDDAEYELLKNNYILTPYTGYRMLLPDEVIHKNILEYETALELSLLVYNKGTMMYMEMENIMGEEKLLQTISDYYETYAYSIVSDEEWKAFIKQSHTYDWDAFFDKWLYGKAA